MYLLDSAQSLDTKASLLCPKMKVWKAEISLEAEWFDGRSEEKKGWRWRMIWSWRIGG